MPGQAAFHDQRDKTASHFRSESEQLLLALIAQTGIRLQTAMDSRFRPLGLTAQEAALLICCAEAKSRSSGELASVIGRDKGGVTRHLDKQEARGLIERFTSSRDRRVTMVRATRLSRKLAPRCGKAFLEARSQFLGEFLEVEIHQLLGMLSRISARLGTSTLKL
jgi:DNA-binding MarR family transcriptional regulator